MCVRCRNCCDEVDDGQLQGVQVLHLIDLYPAVFLIGILGFLTPLANSREAVVRHDEQVLKINQVVFALILFVLLGDGHLVEQLPDSDLRAEVVALHACGCLVEIYVVVDVEHRLFVVGHPLHLAYLLHRSNVVAVAALRVKSQLARLVRTQLLHQVGKVDDIEIFAAALGILHHLHFVLVEIASHDADGIIVVDDGGLGGNHVVFKQELRAETVDVTHIDLSNLAVIDVFAYALYHAPCSTVGERQAEHVVIGHTVALVGTSYAFGENLSLPASRRCQHQMIAAFGIDHLSLTLVGLKGFARALFCIHESGCYKYFLHAKRFRVSR